MDESKEARDKEKMKKAVAIVEERKSKHLQEELEKMKEKLTGLEAERTTYQAKIAMMKNEITEINNLRAIQQEALTVAILAQAKRPRPLRSGRWLEPK